MSLPSRSFCSDMNQRWWVGIVTFDRSQERICHLPGNPFTHQLVLAVTCTHHHRSSPQQRHQSSCMCLTQELPPVAPMGCCQHHQPGVFSRRCESFLWEESPNCLSAPFLILLFSGIFYKFVRDDIYICFW